MATQTLGLVGTLSSPGSLSGRLSNATLRGERVELRVNENNYLQYRYEGQNDSQWQDLIDLNNLNYEELQNKPTVNDITLIGNLTPADLGLSTRAEGVATISRNGLTYTVTRPDGSTFSFDQLDQENVIESVSVNGTQLAVNNKNVDVAVPTATSQLQNDSDYATNAYVDGEISALDTKIDNEITALDAKIDSEISAVSDSIPTAVSQLTNDANYATQSYVDSGIDSIAAAIPTKVSDFTNDEGFTTQTYVDTELAKKEDVLQYGTASSTSIGKALMPKTVSDGKVTEWKFGEAGKVDDVQINKTSILSNKIANIPIANTSKLGVVKAHSLSGISIDAQGVLNINPATSAEIQSGINPSKPIVTSNEYAAAFYGLAKAAGDRTQSESSNSIGKYTDEAKGKIQSMLGIDTAIANAVGQITGFDFSVVQELPVTGTKGVIYLVAHTHDENDVYDEYIWITDKYERLGTLDIDLSNYVTFDDYATINNAGVVKVNSSYGIASSVNGTTLSINKASSANIKAGTEPYKPITPANQNESAFYGLASAAGDSTQSASANAVGIYTDDAKSAIQTMLGVPSSDDVVTDVQLNGISVVTDGVAEIPRAGTGNKLGVVAIKPQYGVSMIDGNGNLGTFAANGSEIKSGTHNYYPIVPSHQHESAFYGLAKAAGHDEKDSTESLGTYTAEAKTAIQSMLGVPADDEVVKDVQINGTSIVSNGAANIPIANTNTPGLFYTSDGSFLFQGGEIKLNRPSNNYIKAGIDTIRIPTIAQQNLTVFYGLAKAAGDTTQSQSSNTVGTYTDEAKTAIKNMIGITDPETITTSQIDALFA